MTNNSKLEDEINAYCLYEAYERSNFYLEGRYKRTWGVCVHACVNKVRHGKILETWKAGEVT